MRTPVTAIRRLRPFARRTIMTCTALVAVVAPAAAFASPASATMAELSHDDVYIAATHVDFGNGPHLVGFPTRSGKMTWYTDTNGDVETGMLSGTVYYDDALRSGCGRVRVRYYSNKGDLLATRHSARACRSSWGTVRSASVDEQYASASLAYAKVNVQYNSSSSASNSWHNEGETVVVSL